MVKRKYTIYIYYIYLYVYYIHVHIHMYISSGLTFVVDRLVRCGPTGVGLN